MTRRLHIGGVTPAEGWEILNILPGKHVDHVGNANDLSQFADGTFSGIYASHILEHLDFKGEIEAALKEWCRVLEPGGKLHVSVPDLDTLARILATKKKLTREERFHVMCMMFGGHIDEHDYHVVGLAEDFLRDYLEKAGFASMQRVKEFGLFDDTSSLRFKGLLISLNVIASKPG